MWLTTITKLDASSSLEQLFYYGPYTPMSLSLSRQYRILGDQPVLLLRRNGKTVALISDDTLPTSICEALMSAEKETDPIVMVPTPNDQSRAERRALAEGDLARLGDLLDAVMLSLQRTDLQLVPLSEAPSRVAEWLGSAIVEGMCVSKGLAPFALPPGTPEVESIVAWASNRSQGWAPGVDCFAPFYSEPNVKVYSMYHKETLERFGVPFGEEGGFSMCDMARYVPLVVPSHVGVLQIDVDYFGYVDSALLPYCGSYLDMRIGFIHLPLPEGNRAESNQETDFEQCKARAMCALFCVEQQPFYLDITDGIRHHILYRTRNSCVTVHTDCTPTEAYYLLSGLLRGEITYGGPTPDPGHFRCPATQSATPTDNPEVPASADSSVISGTIDAEFATPYVEGALNQMPVNTDTSGASDSEICRYMDEEEFKEFKASLLLKELEESRELEAAREEHTDALQSDGDESESDCSEDALSDGGSDSCWSACLDEEWQVI